MVGELRERATLTRFVFKQNFVLIFRVLYCGRHFVANVVKSLLY